jgi:hypothetical protein
MASAPSPKPGHLITIGDVCRDFLYRRLYWHKEKICSPSQRHSLIAKTKIGIFRIVPNDFMPLDMLMAGSSVTADSYEVHLLCRGRPAQVLGKKAKTIAAAKDFASWHYERRCA